jgi:hypothetical protein
MFTTLNLIKQQRGENKKIMVMGVLKYAPKWITTTTKGKELKMEILCVIYMSQSKLKTQNHIEETIPKLTTLNF